MSLTEGKTRASGTKLYLKSRQQNSAPVRPPSGPSLNETKMYILVRSKAPKGLGVNSVGHAVLMCYLKFKNDPEMKSWVRESFRKVTCIVSDEEFELAKKAGDYIEFKENDLDNITLSAAFKPRKKFPCYFSGFRLYG